MPLGTTPAGVAAPPARSMISATMGITLYQYPGSTDVPSVSPPCLKVYLALRHLNADHEVVNLRRGSRAARLTRTGRLPVLDIDGRRIPDSIDIMDALQKRFPGAELWPSDERQALVDRLWEHFVNDHVYFVGLYLRWISYRERTMAAFFGRAPWWIRLGARWTLLPRARRRAEIHGIGGKDDATVHETVERSFVMLAQGLEGGPFLQGRETPARGDLAAAGMLAQLGWRDSLPPVVERFRAYPDLGPFIARVFEACKMPPPGWLAAPASNPLRSATAGP